ncbi:MAG: GtrA family protein [Rikenellaceae bacterium]
MQRDKTNRGDQKILSSFIQRVVDLFYLPIIGRYVARDQFRYFCCGVANYIILDSVLYYLIYHYLVAERYIYIGIATISPHVAALAIVFPITFFTGFLLNRYVVFESTSRKFKFQIARYAVSVMGSILLNYAIIKILVEWVGMWATPSKIICSIITAVYSFFMARCFAFTVVKEK